MSRNAHTFAPLQINPATDVIEPTKDAVQVIKQKLDQELKEWELQTVAVMCGQGLVDHVDFIDEKLKAGCPGHWEPFEGVLVYASSSTYAAEESGLPPNMEAMPGAMEAMLRRLFNE